MPLDLGNVIVTVMLAAFIGGAAWMESQSRRARTGQDPKKREKPVESIGPKSRKDVEGNLGSIEPLDPPTSD